MEFNSGFKGLMVVIVGSVLTPESGGQNDADNF